MILLADSWQYVIGMQKKKKKGKTGSNLRDINARQDGNALGDKLMGKESQKFGEASKFRD